VFVDARVVCRCATLRVKETFDRLVGRAGIVPAAKRRPRLHDLRHTFAVRALQGSPADRSRSGAHMGGACDLHGIHRSTASTARRVPASDRLIALAQAPFVMVSRIGGGGHKSAIKSPPAPHLLNLPIRQVMGVAHYLP